MNTRYLTAAVLFLMCVATAHAMVVQSSYDGHCSLSSYRYDEHRPEPLACLDIADYDGTIAILLRNQGDETLTLGSVTLTSGYYYAYEDKSTGMTQPQAACSMKADRDKDGVPEELSGLKLAAGDSIIAIGSCRMGAQYSYNALNVVYTEPSGIVRTISGSAYSSTSNKTTLSSFSPFFFTPIVIILIISVYVVLAAMRSRRKTIIMGGKQ